MSRTDHQVLFTSLGFLAVVLKDTPATQQSEKAKVMAELIEAFCRLTVPQAFEAGNAVDQTELGLLQEAMQALQLCLDEDDLTFSSEQQAERALRKLKAKVA